MAISSGSSSVTSVSRLAASAVSAAAAAAAAAACGIDSHVGSHVGRRMDGGLTCLQLLPACSTRLRYISLLAHVIRAYGALRLTHLTAHHLSTLYARLQQSVSVGGAGLSAGTAHHIHTVLHQALDDAMKLDLAPLNVAERVNAPKLRRAVIDPYTREVVDRLLAAARGDRLEALYILAVTTGMRLGELLALTWRQIDLTAADGASLQVVATIQHDAKGK